MRFSASQGLSVVVMTIAPLFFPLGQDRQDKPEVEKTPTILFICEHGAAKSVIASAYFDRFAKEKGLAYRAVFRGTNPDPVLAGAAEKGLNRDGIETLDWKPQLVTKADLESASMIVTLGCDLPDKSLVSRKVAEWNDIPSVSEDYEVARNDIVKRVKDLVDSLMRNEISGMEKKKP